MFGKKEGWGGRESSLWRVNLDACSKHEAKIVSAHQWVNILPSDVQATKGLLRGAHPEDRPPGLLFC